MTTADTLDRGREAFRRQAWADAYTLLTAADRAGSLEPEDLQRLATAAYLIGMDSESADAWTRAHHEFASRDAVERAARCAFWLGYGLLKQGEAARGGGWLARAGRLLDEGGHDCVERGYLLLPVALQCIGAGDLEGARAAFTEAIEIGERFVDPDLVTFGRHGCGRVLLRQDRISKGTALLDEAMVAVEAGEVSPMIAGEVYCSMIEACHEIFDLRRAREWTAALSDWCASQPDLVAYRGQCLVRRAEIMRLHGAWPDAMDEAERACERLTAPPGEPAAGAAFYQRAELHRLRGEFDEAEDAYREASRWGRNPQPGLALLRLAQGQLDAARAAICRALHEAKERRTRAGLLSAHVEIMLAMDDVQAARAAADELSEIAAAFGAPLLRALAGRAQGAVLLAEDDARSALDPLRRASTACEQLEAPYEAARVRVLIGLACRALRDEDTAALEFDAARRDFRQLGASLDLARLDGLGPRAASAGDHGLTPRERQVLRRIAAGETNKDVAAALFISERTVERHVSNILSKLHVSSRTAATAYAYEHDLV